MQRFHAFQVIISYGLYLFNHQSDFQYNDTLSNIVGMYLIMICSCTLINSSWILTSTAVIAMSISTLMYYGTALNFSIQQLATSIILILILLCYVSYQCEKQSKSEFLQLRFNERLQQDMSSVIEELPEAVVILNMDKKEVLMAN